jgi:hypothetical protein
VYSELEHVALTWILETLDSSVQTLQVGHSVQLESKVESMAPEAGQSTAGKRHANLCVATARGIAGLK